MANIALNIKREAIIQGWNVWITAVTGTKPIIERTQNGANISWQAGQAKKMENYLNNAMSSKPSKDDMNVSVKLSPVLVPLIFKKYWPYMAVFSTTLILIGRFSR